MSRLFSRTPFADRRPSGPETAVRAEERGGNNTGRIVFAACVLALAFAVVSLRMGALALEGPIAQRARVAPAPDPVRAPLVDREGRLIAETLDGWEVFIRPNVAAEIGGVSPEKLERLAEIFPRADFARLRRELADPRDSWAWIERRASPDQWRRARDLGIVGLDANQRKLRIYPPGRLVSHVVGGVDIDLIGVAGAEAALEQTLTDPGREGAPVALSIDLRVQAAMRRTLSEAMSEFAALGAAGMLMDIRSGEMLSMVSLRDFDPNNRDQAPLTGTRIQQARSPLFNKATLGSYDLGSIFKLITAAMAIEEGAADLDTRVDARTPILRGGFRITDFFPKNKIMSVEEVIEHSSNIGSVRLAEMVGPAVHEAYFRKLGFDKRVPLAELPAGERAVGLLPGKWGPSESATVAYGHGISITPLHLLTAIASLANEGCRVTPTLLKRGPQAGCDRIVSAETSRKVRHLMRVVGERSSGRNANLPGYSVGGKTGTAHKPFLDRPGYDTSTRFNSFLAVWPTDRPQYAIMISLDDPKLIDGTRGAPTAGKTAAVTAGSAIQRIAPLLGQLPSHRFGGAGSEDD